MRKVEKGFTLIELLVVIAIIGILAAIILPAVQSAREAARKTDCLNRLKQVGTATFLFHDTNKAFPPARLYSRMDAAAPYDQGKNQPSWFVRILPFVEQENFYNQWELSKPYDSHPQSVVSQPIATFICPTRRSISNAMTPSANISVDTRLPCGCGAKVEIAATGGATGDFAGNHGDLSPGSIGAETDYYYGGNGTGVIISAQAYTRPDGKLDWTDRISYASITDGSSNTFLAGELHVTPTKLNTMPFNGPIYNGEDLAAFTRVGGPGVPISTRQQEPDLSIPLGFGSWHLGVCNFVFADGSTKSVSNAIDTVTLGQLCNRKDGDVLNQQ